MHASHGDHHHDTAALDTAAVALTRSTTVPRQLVHRAAIAEVFLTDSARLDDDHYLVAAQWPRSHALWGGVTGQTYDLLIVVETLRQTGLLVANRYLGATPDAQFLLTDLALDIDPHRLVIGAGPAEPTVRARTSEVRHRGDRLAHLAVTVEILDGDRPIAAGTATSRVIEAPAYRRLRAAALDTAAPTADGPEPLAPETVGRLHRGDVVLGAPTAPGTWPLRHLLHHPVLFDHAVDHLPGVYLLEAMRQAVHAAHPGTPVATTGTAVRFHRYAELGRPTAVRVDTGAGPVHVTVEQDGTAVGTADFRITHR